MGVAEHAEHIAHAGHGDAKSNSFAMYVGITMASLGVLLAFCSAKVGGERTELVQLLLEQSAALGKYNAQDVKHRLAYLALEQIHSQAFNANSGANINKNDALSMADTVERYLNESKLAKDWAESYEPTINIHVFAQEFYEIAQLFAEIGIVISSVALLLKRKIAWYLSLLLGICSIAIVGKTFIKTHSEVIKGEEDIKTHLDHYRKLREKNKTTEKEEKLLKGIEGWAN